MKKRVFITGATGTMGSALLDEFMKRRDRFMLTVLARDSKKNRRKLSVYMQSGCVDVIWGNLLNAVDVEKGVRSADFVLHLGGMVSPAADYYPEETFRVNTTSMRHIVKAVLSRHDRDSVGVVNIGSVAQYGEHMPPRHWGRCGDLLDPPHNDGYALSKVASERILSDSGLKKWVSLRQSAVLSPALINKATDPITFHVPLRGVLEWVTDEQSARLLANICEDSAPTGFWQNFYNIGGGSSFRLTNYEFEARLMKAMHCPPPEKVFDARWFATQNFHGMWFEDSDHLEEMFHFRQGLTAKEYFSRFAVSLPWYFKLAPAVPSFVMKAVMKWVAGRNRLAPLYWKKHNVKERIDAHFGGISNWKNLPSWNGLDLSRPSDILPSGMSHAIKSLSQLTLDDMRAKAEERGGRCLSDSMIPGDMTTLLDWQTADGTRFKASPASVFLGGHWGTPVQSPEISAR